MYMKYWYSVLHYLSPLICMKYVLIFCSALSFALNVHGICIDLLFCFIFHPECAWNMHWSSAMYMKYLYSVLHYLSPLICMKYVLIFCSALFFTPCCSQNSIHNLLVLCLRFPYSFKGDLQVCLLLVFL
jgi:hypothetical protein